jgi:hypothetical protein
VASAAEDRERLERELSMLAGVRRLLADSEPDLRIPTTTIDLILDEYLALSEPDQERTTDPTDRPHPKESRPAGSRPYRRWVDDYRVRRALRRRTRAVARTAVEKDLLHGGTDREFNSEIDAECASGAVTSRLEVRTAGARSNQAEFLSHADRCRGPAAHRRGVRRFCGSYGALPT